MEGGGTAVVVAPGVAVGGEDLGELVQGGVEAERVAGVEGSGESGTGAVVEVRCPEGQVALVARGPFAGSGACGVGGGDQSAEQSGGAAWG